MSYFILFTINFQFNILYLNDIYYIGCVVLAFRAGSIIVDYRLRFRGQKDIGLVEDVLNEELDMTDGLFSVGTYTYDPPSLVVRRKFPNPQAHTKGNTHCKP